MLTRQLVEAYTKFCITIFLMARAHEVSILFASWTFKEKKTHRPKEIGNEIQNSLNSLRDSHFLSTSILAAAAAAKSLQSWPILCNPIDGSPPGSSVPGTLQARILEWVTISFSVGMLRGYQNQEKAG